MNIIGQGNSMATVDILQLLFSVIVLFSASSIVYSMISIIIKVKTTSQGSMMYEEKNTAVSVSSAVTNSHLYAMIEMIIIGVIVFHNHPHHLSIPPINNNIRNINHTEDK